MPTKTKNTETTNNVSLTTKDRESLRQAILEYADTREFVPLDFDTVRAVCKTEHDLAKLEDGLKSGRKTTIELDLGKDDEKTIAFLRSWLAANGQNRTPKSVHFGRLAVAFRKDDSDPEDVSYDSSCTHFVVMKNRQVGNGGHSGRAFCIAFYPESIFYGLDGSPVLDKDGNTIDANSEVAETYLGTNEEGEDMSFGGYYYERDGIVYASKVPPVPEDFERVGEYEVDEKSKVARFVVGSDNPSYREAIDDLTVNFVFNAPNSAVLKMDDIRLSADYADFLEMVGPIRSYLSQEMPPELSPAAIGQIARGWYLRTNGKRQQGKPETFGTLSKGGNLNKADVQWWFLTFAPMLIDSIELLKDANGKLRSFPAWSVRTDDGRTRKLSVKDALVAMMVSDQKGRERIAKALLVKPTAEGDLPKATPEGVVKMIDYICPASSRVKTPNADEIVSCLVLYGLGKNDPVDVIKQEHFLPSIDDEEQVACQVWHLPEYRAEGWDRNNPDDLADGEEKRKEVFAAMSEAIASILGSTEVSDSAKRKNRKPRKKSSK